MMVCVFFREWSYVLLVCHIDMHRNTCSYPVHYISHAQTTERKMIIHDLYLRDRRVTP